MVAGWWTVDQTTVWTWSTVTSSVTSSNGAGSPGRTTGRPTGASTAASSAPAASRRVARTCNPATGASVPLRTRPRAHQIPADGEVTVSASTSTEPVGTVDQRVPTNPASTRQSCSSSPAWVSSMSSAVVPQSGPVAVAAHPSPANCSGCRSSIGGSVGSGSPSTPMGGAGVVAGTAVEASTAPSATGPWAAVTSSAGRDDPQAPSAEAATASTATSRRNREGVRVDVLMVWSPHTAYGQHEAARFRPPPERVATSPPDARDERDQVDERARWTARATTASAPATVTARTATGSGSTQGDQAPSASNCWLTPPSGAPQ